MRSYRYLFIVSLVALVCSSSCGKYEEGPELSLRSKKTRLTGKWTAVKLNGEPYPFYEKYSLEFWKDGRLDIYVQNEPNGPDPYQRPGLWKWEDDKKKIVLYTATAPETIEVLRLTNDEFWFRDMFGNRLECTKE